MVKSIPIHPNKELTIRIVSSQEDLIKAFIVRALVYMQEQDCPYSEEFDLNDHTSTQILGLIGDEPVLTARIRYFGGFAKFERLAVREKFRGKGYGHVLLRFMLRLCLSKGFRTFYLHAQKRLESFYNGYGFQTMRSPFAFSDHDYIEMVLSLPESKETKSIEWNPHVLNRPEGQWDEPGPIEKSLDRMQKNKREIV